MKFFAAAACLAALALPYARAQSSIQLASPCRGTTLTGTVRDATLALIPDATITLDGTQKIVSNADGQFRLSCVAPGSHHITAVAQGFATRNMSVTAPHAAALDFTLNPEAVETQVTVSGDEPVPTSSNSTGAAQTISGNRLQSLADDPDDLLKQLQQIGAASGGSASGTTIAIDGFQGNGDGSTTLPPKSSIAYIKVNPDQFSAEYREPPFGGGRVEIYTRPGQPTFHGALFTTNNSPWMNARDPFSRTRAQLGKQRYGFELTGPVRRKGSSLTLALEHRSIDNFAVVNAISLDSSGNQVPIISNVATPQRLWVGTARVDWQLGPRNTFIVNFTPNVNHLVNLGVGGSSLPQAGYDRASYDHVLRLTNVTTVSAKLMHEARVYLEWDGDTNTPASTAPQLQVAGAFTGGGATLGPQRLRELDAEYDDDAILNTKNHLLKFGVFVEFLDEHKRLTNNFNGTFNFGGGIAPVLDANSQPTGQTQTISGLEQYRRALKGLPGGSPTAYSNVAGNPEVDLVQTRLTLFFQDDWKLLPRLTFSYGLRYYAQNNFKVTGSLTPRFGFAWSPDKKSTWTIHAHAGLFNGRYLARTYGEFLRMDGVQRVTSTIYNPTCSTVSPTACNPFTGATPIHSLRSQATSLPNLTFGIENIGLTHSFPHGWNVTADYYIAQMWHYTRSANINSPLNDSPTGPRPGPANTNIFQLRSDGRGYGNLWQFNINQRAFKRIQFGFGGGRFQLVDNTNDDLFFTPQTTGSNAGEMAHRNGNSLWTASGNATITLPSKIQFSSNLNANSGGHYNITTGFDNNGDGSFNDRPQYALPGTPACGATPATTACATATPWGLLVASGGTGVFGRNKGVMPWTIYFDSNIQRAFKLTRNAKAEHQQTLTANIRAANTLNHRNVTQVGGVLGSPQFGIPYAADNGRRIEAGLRYSF